MWVNQNNNESIHHRLFRIINKSKSFKYEHIKFAALVTALIHNVGNEGCVGRMYQAMGTYYEEEQRIFRWRDDNRRKNSTEKHGDDKNKSRYMFHTPLVDGGQPNYDPGLGFEDVPIDGLRQFEEQQQNIARDAANSELSDANLDIDKAEQNHEDIDEEL